MKRILEFFKGLFSDWGLDKWAHLGIGGLACALITIAMILAEHQVSPWRMLLFPLGGAICVFIFSFFKEMINDNERVFSEKIYLAVNDSPESWLEVTPDYKAQWELEHPAELPEEM